MRAGTKVNASDLADACGVSRQAVSQWMLNQSKGLRADHLFLAADYLDVDARWLATGEGDMEKGTAIVVGGLTQEQRAAIEAVLKSFKK
jgi:transcriptional regulator with XRE-family HTH domain